MSRALTYRRISRVAAGMLLGLMASGCFEATVDLTIGEDASARVTTTVRAKLADESQQEFWRQALAAATNHVSKAVTVKHRIVGVHEGWGTYELSASYAAPGRQDRRPAWNGPRPPFRVYHLRDDIYLWGFPADLTVTPSVIETGRIALGQVSWSGADRKRPASLGGEYLRLLLAGGKGGLKLDLPGDILDSNGTILGGKQIFWRANAEALGTGSAAGAQVLPFYATFRWPQGRLFRLPKARVKRLPVSGGVEERTPQDDAPALEPPPDVLVQEHSHRFEVSFVSATALVRRGKEHQGRLHDQATWVMRVACEEPVLVVQRKIEPDAQMSFSDGSVTPALSASFSESGPLWTCPFFVSLTGRLPAATGIVVSKMGAALDLLYVTRQTSTEDLRLMTPGRYHLVWNKARTPELKLVEAFGANGDFVVRGHHASWPFLCRQDMVDWSSRGRPVRAKWITTLPSSEAKGWEVTWRKTRKTVFAPVVLRVYRRLNHHRTVLSLAGRPVP